MKIIDLSSICWHSENREIPVKDMHTDHVIRALAWLTARKSMSEQIQGKIPAIFREQLLKLNDRTFDEWIDIFSAVLHDRAEKETSEKLTELNAELEKLMPPDDKIKALKAEIKLLSE